MKMRSLAVAAAACLVAVPAFAGLQFESTTTMEGPQGEMVVRTQGWVEGDRAKVVILESDNPLLAGGSYLLTSDAGRTLVLVNPEEKTYMPFDLGQMAGSAMAAMGGMVKMEFSNHQVERLSQEPGPQIHGHATTHYRYRTAYDSDIRVMGMRQSSSNEVVTDAWTTTELADAGVSAWLRSEPPKTGMAELDELIAAQAAQMVAGVPLKMVSVSTSRDKKNGQEMTNTMTMEVTSMRETTVPASTFAMPAGYEEVDLSSMMPFGRQ